MAWVDLDIVSQSKFCGSLIVCDKFVHTAIIKRLPKVALAGFKSNKLETRIAKAVSLNMQRTAQKCTCFGYRVAFK